MLQDETAKRKSATQIFFHLNFCETALGASSGKPLNFSDMRWCRVVCSFSGNQSYIIWTTLVTLGIKKMTMSVYPGLYDI